MNRIRPYAIVIAALFMLGTASLVQAQPGDAAEAATAAAAEITQIDLAGHTLTVQRPGGGDAIRYSVAPTTRITSGSHRIAFKDLQLGWRVIVHSDPGASDNASASRIEVVGVAVP